MRIRYPYLPHVLSALALAVALAGVTPASAVNTVKRALFAKNSGAVDGISASRTPRAGQLLPLDAQGQFPGSVLPPAAAGPRGPRGVEGPAGPRGPATAYATRIYESIALPRAKYVFQEVAKLTGLPAGKWVMNFSVGASWFDPGGLITICRIRVDGADASVQQSVLGGSAGSSRQAVLAGTGAVDRPAPFAATVECAADQDVLPDTRPQVVIFQRQFTAIRVSELTVQ